MNSRFTDLPPDHRVSIHVVADKVNRNRHPMRPPNLTVKEKNYSGIEHATFKAKGLMPRMRQSRSCDRWVDR